jgi:hypothetical protein
MRFRSGNAIPRAHTTTEKWILRGTRLGRGAREVRACH